MTLDFLASNLAVDLTQIIALVGPLLYLGRRYGPPLVSRFRREAAPQAMPAFNIISALMILLLLAAVVLQPVKYVGSHQAMRKATEQAVFDRRSSQPPASAAELAEKRDERADARQAREEADFDKTMTRERDRSKAALNDILPSDEDITHD